jgi:hypothetical protein
MNYRGIRKARRLRSLWENPGVCGKIFFIDLEQVPSGQYALPLTGLYLYKCLATNK